MTIAPRLAAGLGLIVALILPSLFTWGLSLMGIQQSVAIAIIPLWAITLLMLAIVRGLEGESWSSIGLRRPSRMDLGCAVAGFALGFLLIVASDPLVQLLGLRSAESVASQQLSPAMPLILLTSPTTEEILFRGYAIERLETLTRRTGVAVVVSIAAFLFAHVPLWGLGGALQFLPWTIVISGLYVWRRNLPACMVMHFLGDLLGLAVIPRFAA